MKAGNLDRRVRIERELELVDAYGTTSRTSSPVVTVWAQLITASTDEILAGNVEASSTVVVFRIRWRDDVRLDDHVIYNGQSFNIVGMKELGRRDGLELRVEAKP
ncbi:phage head closure protein [Aureimonas leprariae]|uniref:Phage head closure protein n=1 Tax=Plantimonas leprariae TaxID=2615207 RepID=A0A7V7PNR7_9HYPH|nr:phage head closure protein [Aureimonas leprariae]KAB0679526.1 phage head closure protein [Aureimonas leprariae]